MASPCFFNVFLNTHSQWSHQVRSVCDAMYVDFILPVSSHRMDKRRVIQYQ